MAKVYIEKEAAITAIGKPKVTPGGVIFDAMKKACQEEVRNLPAADVVEVVRCGECVFWEPASPTRTSGNCNRSFEILAWATDFCSYGNRKNGGQHE